MFNRLLFHRVQAALVIKMVDAGEEVGFHFLAEVAELHLHRFEKTQWSKAKENSTNMFEKSKI